MATINFGGVLEEVVTREEFPMEKAREVLKDETIAIIGYGVQGPGQALNLKDNGFNVIIGQRKNSKTWIKPLLTDGYPAKPSSKSKKPPRKAPSSNTCSATPVRSHCGRP